MFNNNFRLFERCSGGFLNLRFDSPILESYYTLCSFPHSLFRFRIAILFFALVCSVWLLFFSITGVSSWIAYVSGAATGVCIAFILFGLTFSKKILKKHSILLYLLVALFFSVLFLLSFAIVTVGVSVVFNLSLILQLLIIVYTNIPLRLWQVILLCGPVSLIHIGLSCFTTGTINGRIVCIYIVVHICIHMVGILQHLLSQVRRRSTFMRLGHSALMRKALEKEQSLRNEMIQSLMPQQVAQEVMRGVGKLSNDDQVNDESDNDSFGGEITIVKKSKKKSKRSRKNSLKMKALSGSSTKRGSSFSKNSDEAKAPLSPDAKCPPSKSRSSTSKDDGSESDSDSANDNTQKTVHAVRFRKFHVNQMENVSILFADIVGFTKMSSNKTASHLVFLLNDLFGRFDSLCELTKCEKIATLGDCYYCVSGCPNSVEDHAERIVEMGRSMVVAIQQFDSDHNEMVNMRVGVHTGKVICGIVGTRRFKFDVWSNDVTLANKMESSGEAGKVHISEATLEFVKDIYEVSNGDSVPDIRKVKVLVEFFNKEEQCYAIKHTQDEASIKTYFIERRFDDKPPAVLDSTARVSIAQGEISVVDNIVDPYSSNAANSEIPIEPFTPSNLPFVVPESESKARGSDFEMLEALWNLSKPEEVFKFPPISHLTLIFNSAPLEVAYRRQVLRIPRRSMQLTLAVPRLSPLVNGIAHFIVFVAIIIMCFVNFPYPKGANFNPLLPISILLLGVAMNLFFLVVVFLDIIAWSSDSNRNDVGKVTLSSWKKLTFRTYQILFSWIIRNFYCAVMVCSPVAFVLANLQLCLFWMNRYSPNYGPQFSLGEYRVVHGLIYAFMLFSFTLFPNYSSWIKSLSASFMGVIVILLVHWPFDLGLQTSNCSHHMKAFPTSFTDGLPPPNWVNASEGYTFSWEITIVILLNLILIWVLNREIDISFRVSFNRDFEASCAKRAISQEKIKGEWLLENIIPPYVLSDLRKTNKYSQHVVDAGVMFASIANFSDFYDEQYQGGQEMLRVLNEIFADFEHQLHSSRFKDVEKIKTIAECFMVASGLNVVQRSANKESNDHLYALMDFGMELIRILDEFNQQMFNFKFQLKIGYNIGEVTAGVIGTTKLLYDIWGDTVNVASRMYSTGQKARIQVTEDVSNRLSSRYDFEYRGDVFVKGKGDMKTYLLVGRKNGSKV